MGFSLAGFLLALGLSFIYLILWARVTITGSENFNFGVKTIISVFIVIFFFFMPPEFDFSRAITAATGTNAVQVDSIETTSKIGQKEQSIVDNTPLETIPSDGTIIEYYGTCEAMQRKYPKGVPSDHPAYNEELDEDNVGWACATTSS